MNELEAVGRVVCEAVGSAIEAGGDGLMYVGDAIDQDPTDSSPVPGFVFGAAGHVLKFIGEVIKHADEIP